MKRKDILRKLEERLARGEINEKTYLEIKARYESEPDEPEESEEAAPPSVDLGSAIGGAVAQATADATRMANDAERRNDQNRRKRRGERQPRQDARVQVGGEREGPRVPHRGSRPHRGCLHLRRGRPSRGIPFRWLRAHCGELAGGNRRIERVPPSRREDPGRRPLRERLHAGEGSRPSGGLPLQRGHPARWGSEG